MRQSRCRLGKMIFAVLLGFTGALLPLFPGGSGGVTGAALSGQEREVLRIASAGAGAVSVPLLRHRGYPAVSEASLRQTGWRVETSGDRYRASLPGGLALEIHPGTPFVRLDTVWAQLVDAPYTRRDSLYLPLQVFTDFLPDRLPELYRTVGSREIVVLEPMLWAAGWEGGGVAGGVRGQGPGTHFEDDGVRVVIIDAGHGGVDPGTLGRRRTREKDVTLAVARALARELEGEPGLEVHMTRDEDVLVPLWERGEIATRMKGDRYGIFLSIHANSVTRQDVRGVETYFLSEARTEHEARVAALENSAMELERGRPSGPAQGELGAIISELLNLDFQHWSSDLAARVQGELTDVHPGPDRGVKQGPLAVLTNAMMPSVLIELGFISNTGEEELLTDASFHEDAAKAIARAVRDFFRRYPPGAAPPTGLR